MHCQDQDHRDRGGHQHHHHHHDHHDPFNTGGAGQEQGPGFLVRGHLVETGWIIAGLQFAIHYKNTMHEYLYEKIDWQDIISSKSLKQAPS